MQLGSNYGRHASCVDLSKRFTQFVDFGKLDELRLARMGFESGGGLAPDSGTV